jgi:hypothetical protein
LNRCTPNRGNLIHMPHMLLVPIHVRHPYPFPWTSPWPQRLHPMACPSSLAQSLKVACQASPSFQCTGARTSMVTASTWLAVARPVVARWGPRWHEFDGESGSAPDMMSVVESYLGIGAAWRQREGVGAMEFNGSEARGGRWQLGLGSGSTALG